MANISASDPLGTVAGKTTVGAAGLFAALSPASYSSDARSGKSAAVTMALTPGRASARRASMLTMRAWACGLRLTLAHSIPGMTKSAP